MLGKTNIKNAIAKMTGQGNDEQDKEGVCCQSAESRMDG